VSGINIANLSAGIYSFQATDANSCVLTESIEIFEPTLISLIDSVVSDVTCYAYSDGAINLTTAGGTAPFTYLWSSGQTSEDVANLTAGNYAVTITDTNNCQRNFGFVLIQPPVLAAASSIDQPTCFGYADGTVFTTVIGGTAPFSFLWNNGVTSADNVNISPGVYDVTVTDNNNCSFTLSTVLTQPAQIQVSFIADVLVGCDPLVVNLTNDSQEQFSSNWTFGDGTDGIGNQIEHTFSGEGCFDVNLQITDIDGCTNNVTYSDFICVLETPDAEIGLSPNYVGIANPDVEITNLTSGADTYSWSFGDTEVYNYFQPGIVTYPTYVSDQYYVSLIAYNDNGCVDSTFRIINFDNSLVIYVPNAFTPDGDEFNNIFKPIFAAPVASYNLKIYNRWGEILFESNDTEVGWNGTYNGTLVQDGAYTWDILVTTFETRTYRKQGTVSILK
jgi:gliding motility-associated-like protein